jgi:hypothetical protein
VQINIFVYGQIYSLFKSINIRDSSHSITLATTENA